MELDLYKDKEEQLPFVPGPQPVPPGGTVAPTPAPLPIVQPPPQRDVRFSPVFNEQGGIATGAPFPQTPPGPGEAPEDEFGDITELRAEPWTPKFEQAALARADELVAERYNAQRQQKSMELARRNIGPDSPLYNREMRHIDDQQNRELAGFRRNLEIEKIDRRQRNLAQARQLELMLDNVERQRYADLLGALTGNPDYISRASDISGQLASLYGQQAAQGRAGSAAGFGAAGDLFAQLLAGQPSTQPTVINVGQPSYPRPGAPVQLPDFDLTPYDRYQEFA